MTIQIALHHDTHYVYDRPVTLGPQVVRLRPAPHCRTPILSYSLKITPETHFLNWQQDPHGNYLARLVFPEKTNEFRVEVDVVAEMTVINPFDFFIESSAENYPFEYDDDLVHDLRPFLRLEPGGPRFHEYLSAIDKTPRRTVHFLVELNQQLQKDVGYLIRMEPGVQTPEETLTKASGSCRDSSWLLVQLCRHLGLAARFVSGYLVQLTADIKSLDGPSGPECDFTDLHAWAEVYLPGAGWVGLDPTSGLFAGEGHIPLASTPHPMTAAPIAGGVEKCETDFRFDMTVTRYHEDPRVTKPYTEEQWQTIQDVGKAVDQRLIAGDVRLTMGGEPTFVSIDDMEGAEWNTAAVGPTKRLLASNLIKRLSDRFGSGGLLHYGQGKWYPGESLPRWALSCFWRTDGQPLWNNPDLIAKEEVAYNHTPSDAHKFIRRLAKELDVDPKWIVTGYEDIWHFLQQEQKLPVHVDPAQWNLKDSEDRRRLARVIERGMDTPVGCLLPLRHQWWQAQPGWVSGPWPIRSEKLFLLPGDSPMGLRLPLDTLFTSSGDRPWFYDRDPF
jgi:transglutaminase-like putative cysteine protease